MLESFSEFAEWSASGCHKLFNVGQDDKRSESSDLGILDWCGIFTYIIVIYFLVLWIDVSLPSQVPNDGVFQQFSEESARMFLEKLVQIGPRPSGSVQAESNAVSLIMSKIDAISGVVELRNVNVVDTENRNIGYWTHRIRWFKRVDITELSL
ncbi:putative endoplasmic reticulum metallopeptidase 1-A [Ditylenchus destructor]|uniref:Endoplasmic reticulum metallopeptidase 1-A n=1 Tax=Ditylenchus destructor TaxID=166010 RepID=A0AAD4ND10_9BILA|nr:putative endoplasmic reticulum metallopeptidase 1-A [Ditylenchus destructor]